MRKFPISGTRVELLDCSARKTKLNLDSFPRESLRRQLVAIGIGAERHRMRSLLDMLPVRMDGKPYDGLDATDERSAQTILSALIN